MTRNVLILVRLLFLHMMHFLADKELWPILKPDCVIQFGQIVVSKRVQQMLASWDNVEYIEVNPTMTL